MFLLVSVSMETSEISWSYLEKNAAGFCWCTDRLVIGELEGGIQQH